jgi:hypothetical protein
MPLGKKSYSDTVAPPKKAHLYSYTQSVPGRLCRILVPPTANRVEKLVVRAGLPAILASSRPPGRLCRNVSGSGREDWEIDENKNGFIPPLRSTKGDGSQRTNSRGSPASTAACVLMTAPRERQRRRRRFAKTCSMMSGMHTRTYSCAASTTVPQIQFRTSFRSIRISFR